MDALHVDAAVEQDLSENVGVSSGDGRFLCKGRTEKKAVAYMWKMKMKMGRPVRSMTTWAVNQRRVMMTWIRGTWQRTSSLDFL